MTESMRNLLLKIVLSLSLFLAGGGASHAQTVIDLKDGGVRAKTVDDYRNEMKARERVVADSLAYIDHLTRAFNALNEDSLKLAEDLFVRALKVRPDAPGNYVVEYNLGRICMVGKRLPEAIDRFGKALSQRPEMKEARYDRAVCYYELGSTKAAADDCAALLGRELAADMKIRVLFLRSAVYIKTKQADRAKLDLEEILRMNPGHASASLLLAGCLEALGQPQTALNHLNVFVAAHPEHAEGLVARAQLETRMGLTDMARVDYDAVIKLYPEDPGLYVERAKVLTALGEKTAARADADRAVALGYPRGRLTDLYKKLTEK